MINVGGRELPCRLSMGAMLLFKRNLQKDVSDMDANNIEELLMFMWCCVVCARPTEWSLMSISRLSVV